MEYIAQYVDKLSESFDDIPQMKAVADRFNIRTGHIALGLVSFVFLFVVLGLGEVLLTNLLGVIYPAYMSFKAIETKEHDDDKQWLTYWVVYGTFTVVDTVAEVLLFWLPFYHPIKLLFLIFLAWPETKGAQTVYTTVIRPFLLKHSDKIDQSLQQVKAKVEEVKSDAAQYEVSESSKEE